MDGIGNGRKFTFCKFELEKFVDYMWLKSQSKLCLHYFNEIDVSQRNEKSFR